MDLGLHLNLSKCFLFWPTAQQVSVLESYLPGLPEFITFSIRVLDTPIAAEDYVAIELDATLIPVRIAHTHLAEINDPQIELQLLRACFVTCKVNYLCRIVPPPQLALFLRTSTSPSRQSSNRSPESVLGPGVDPSGGRYSHLDINLAHAHALQAVAFLDSLQGEVAAVHKRYTPCTLAVPDDPAVGLARDPLLAQSDFHPAQAAVFSLYDF
jgi:hypothetical protein